MGSRVVLKIVLTAVLWLLVVIASCVPIVLYRYAMQPGVHRTRRRVLERFVGLMGCFCAGLFLGTCLLDLLPDVQKDIECGLANANIKTGFPLTQFIMCCGLFFVILIEQVATSCQQQMLTSHVPTPSRRYHRDVAATERDHHHRSHSSLNPNVNNCNNIGILDDVDHTDPDHHVHRHPHAARRTPKGDQVGSPSSPESPSAQEAHTPLLLADAQPTVRGTVTVAKTTSSERQTATANDRLVVSTERTYDTMTATTGVEEHEHHDHFDTQLFNESPLKAYILLIAISVHGIFEGLSFGLLNKTLTELLQLFGALVLHKPLIGLGISLSMLRSNVPWKNCVIGILIFGTMTPVGVTIGLVLEAGIDEAQLVTGVLQALACGTFLYIVFLEIIPKEFIAEHSDHLTKLLALLMGFGLVCVVQLINESIEGDEVEAGYPRCISKVYIEREPSNDTEKPSIVV